MSSTLTKWLKQQWLHPCSVTGMASSLPLPQLLHVHRQSPRNNLDIAWQQNNSKNINWKVVTCDFCGKTIRGSITQRKRHQMGMRGDIDICMKAPRGNKYAQTIQSTEES